MLLTLGDLSKCISNYSYFILCMYIYDNEWIIIGIVSNKRDIIVGPLSHFSFIGYIKQVASVVVHGRNYVVH